MGTKIAAETRKKLSEHAQVVSYWDDFDFNILENVPVRKKKGKDPVTYSDCIIMADTETSPKTLTPENEEEHRNHVCAWSIAIRSLSVNICMLWGKKPSDMMVCIARIKDKLRSDEIFIYFHNLSYDWIFLRKFFFSSFGWPDNQLNTKPLYPIIIRFGNGITLKDSLVLSQRSLGKWAKDLDVEHKKATGKWNYDLVRDQETWDPTDDELLYISNDVLAGVECIDKTMKILKKSIRSIPLTSTGIPRGDARLIGKKNKAHSNWYLKCMPEHYEFQFIQELCFHGGYTHENRFAKGLVYPNEINFLHWLPKCKDFSSSYPFEALANDFPSGRFWKMETKMSPEEIIKDSKENAFIIRIKGFDVRLKNPRWPMPVLALSKCQSSLNPIVDNGRLLSVEYFDMWVTDPDFELIYEQYRFGKLIIDELWTAPKAPLPKWFTDFIYKLYYNKTTLKGKDPVLYQIEKAKLNAAAFGMCAQKPVKEIIDENYETCEYSLREGFDYEAEYQKTLHNYNSFLPYSVGVWITAYAQRDLFRLGKCVPAGDMWLYSDTDSVYATGFDEEALEVFNMERKQRLIDRGYDPIIWEGREYVPGVAEDDGICMQFKALHSKCYVKRPLVAYGDNFIMGDHLKITVAGVPKDGYKSLDNNINNFDLGFVFDGKTSGKKQHTHYYVPEIYIDEHGNETGDSIELTECDYVINDPNEVDFLALLEEEVNIYDYEDTGD